MTAPKPGRHAGSPDVRSCGGLPLAEKRETHDLQERAWERRHAGDERNEAERQDRKAASEDAGESAKSMTALPLEATYGGDAAALPLNDKQ